MINGVVVIITSPDGHVQAVAGDFNQGAPGGMRIEDMQENRAKDKAWREVFEGHCSGYVGKAIKSDQFAMRQVSASLRTQGWKETTREISVGENYCANETEP